jgi:hypothetical protein
MLAEEELVEEVGHDVSFCPHCGIPIVSQEEWDEHVPECSKSMGHR